MIGTRVEPKVARGFEERLEAVRRAVESPDEPGSRKVLLQALRGKNGYLISVAAKAAVPGLTDALIAAFDRLLEDPVKRDPNCYGKLAIVKALYDADERADALYLTGCRYVQLEPVMGGRQDSAAEVRATCIMALAHQQHPRAMVEAAMLLADPERAARIGAARALAATGNREVAEPLLRLKIATGEADPEALGECFGALLEVAPEDSLPYVAPYLDHHDDDTANAAALALGTSRLRQAFAELHRRAEDFVRPARRPTLLLAIALLRNEQAWTYLLDRIEDAAPPTALAALEALATFGHDQALRTRIQKATIKRNDPALIEAATKALEPSP